MATNEGKGAAIVEINKLLDDCKAKLEVESDYRLARMVNISDQRLSDYRAGKRIPDAYACSRMAEVLGMDEMVLIAHFEAISAKNPTVKEYWEKKLAEMGGIAAAFLLAVNLIMTPTPSQAAPMLKSDGAILYIMLNQVRRLKAIKQAALSLVSQISHFCMAVAGVRQIPA